MDWLKPNLLLIPFVLLLVVGNLDYLKRAGGWVRGLFGGRGAATDAEVVALLREILAAVKERKK